MLGKVSVSAALSLFLGHFSKREQLQTGAGGDSLQGRQTSLLSFLCFLWTEWHSNQYFLVCFYLFSLKRNVEFNKGVGELQSRKFKRHDSVQGERQVIAVTGALKVLKR